MALTTPEQKKQLKALGWKLTHHDAFEEWEHDRATITVWNGGKSHWGQGDLRELAKAADILGLREEADNVDPTE